jgi:hypothetical protein
MVDSVQVFPLGFRVTDANDEPVNNAKIKFREIGPGATKTVYSDPDLTVSLGHTVRTRSDGLPVVSEGSSTTTLIYVGSDPYHIEITDEDDAVIVPAQDDVRGAFTAAEAEAVIPSKPVITTGSNLTLEAEHKGKLINATSNTLTFTSAVTLEDGWWVEVRNNGASGVVTLVAASGVSFEGGSFTQRALLVGEAMIIVCDGTAFRVSSHTPPLLAAQGPGLVTIVDRVSAEPGAPTAGTRYIVSASFGAFTTHQIIEYTGAGWNAYTPPTDCGWVAYVQDEDRYYAFTGSAWVDILNTIRSADLPVGTHVNRAYGEYTANADLTTAIPQDDTIPQQSTEGTEIITAAITLASATNRVRARFLGWGVGFDGSESRRWAAALFLGSTEDALAVGLSGLATNSIPNNVSAVVLEFEHAPGSVGPHTYKIRAGGHTGQTARLNGLSSARLFGGVARATLVLEEIVAS